MINIIYIFFGAACEILIYHIMSLFVSITWIVWSYFKVRILLLLTSNYYIVKEFRKFTHC